jgi:hypothetical protein
MKVATLTLLVLLACSAAGAADTYEEGLALMPTRQRDFYALKYLSEHCEHHLWDREPRNWCSGPHILSASSAARVAEVEEWKLDPAKYNPATGASR